VLHPSDSSPRRSGTNLVLARSHSMQESEDFVCPPLSFRFKAFCGVRARCLMAFPEVRQPTSGGGPSGTGPRPPSGRLSPRAPRPTRRAWPYALPPRTLPLGAKGIVTQEGATCNVGIANLEIAGFGSYAPDFDKPRFHELRPNGGLRNSLPLAAARTARIYPIWGMRGAHHRGIMAAVQCDGPAFKGSGPERRRDLCCS
jgi:hypothetical protein